MLRMDRLPLGVPARVAGLEASGGLRRRLIELGFFEGERVEKVLKSPLGDPSAYLVRGTVTAIRNADAAKVLVQAEDAARSAEPATGNGGAVRYAEPAMTNGGGARSAESVAANSGKAAVFSDAANTNRCGSVQFDHAATTNGGGAVRFADAATVSGCGAGCRVFQGVRWRLRRGGVKMSVENACRLKKMKLHRNSLSEHSLFIARYSRFAGAPERRCAEWV